MLVVAALVPAGCGGEEPQPRSHAELVAKIDARCEVTNAETKKINEEAELVGERADTQEQLLRELAPILERASDQVRQNAAAFKSVEPTGNDAAKLDRIRRFYDRQTRLAHKFAAAAKRGAVDEFKMLSELQKDLLRRLRKATSDFGFKECGSTRSDATRAV